MRKLELFFKKTTWRICGGGWREGVRNDKLNQMVGEIRTQRQKILFKSITVDENKQLIFIKSKRYYINDAAIKYLESRLFSYLEITINDKTYFIKGLKSIWEHLNISTYDILEKSEDNKVFNLFCYLDYLKNSQSQF